MRQFSAVIVSGLAFGGVLGGCIPSRPPSPSPIASWNGEGPCVDPTPTEPDWWHWTWVDGPNGSKSGTVPSPPELPTGLAVDDLAGVFTLSMISTDGTRSVDTTLTAIRFRVDSSVGRGSVLGEASVGTAWRSYLSLAPRDSTGGGKGEPFDLLDSQGAPRLTFVLGNRGLGWTDSGVLFDVFAHGTTAASGRTDWFQGRWVDGGLSVMLRGDGTPGGHPQGYFCLVRGGE